MKREDEYLPLDPEIHFPVPDANPVFMSNLYAFMISYMSGSTAAMFGQHFGIGVGLVVGAALFVPWLTYYIKLQKRRVEIESNH